MLLVDMVVRMRVQELIHLSYMRGVAAPMTTADTEAAVDADSVTGASLFIPMPNSC